MIQTKKRGRITDEEIRKKGQLKVYPQKSLSVITDRTVVGFNQEDVQDISRTIQAMTKELNERIISMFKAKSEVKQQYLGEKMEGNTRNYQERNEHFNREMKEMNDRFDYLKRGEQRWQDVIDYSIVYKEEKQRRRLCFNILKDYAHGKKDDLKRMTLFLRRNKEGMLKKCFYYLRDQGLENRVKRRVDRVFQKVIKEIKIETLKNINDLKEQISLKELEIKNVRAAKSDFSYHFAQSLLKTINTLNLEVLDLKQKDLDDEFKFAGNLDPNVLERIYQQYLKGNFSLYRNRDHQSI